MVIELDFGDSIRKFEQIKDASQAVSSVITKASTAVSRILPDVGQFFTTTTESIDNSFEAIKRIDKSLNNNEYNNEYDKTNALNERLFHQQNITANLADLRRIQQLGSSINNSKQLMSALSTVMPKIYSIAQDATKIFRGISLGSDMQLIDQMKTSAKYKEIQQLTKNFDSGSIDS